MYTQIKCPNCGNPYTAEVHQIIDVGRQPELKQMLLSGQLNMAVCPSCGAAGQLSSALLYHDPKHELFMIFVPQELQLDQVNREQYIGQMARQIIDKTPTEQRRAYMLQPTTVLTMQGFMEKVLETEGITKEMIDRQRKQVELLNTLAKADPDVVDYLIKERSREIDDTFFAMLKSYIESAVQMDDNDRLIPLVNLQARLMTETEAGRRMEKQQIALHALNRDAKQANGLSPALLLKHILKNQEDPAVIDAIVQVGAQALTYEFFTGLTAEIEKQKLAGKNAAADRLVQLRTDLLKFQEELQKQSEQILREAKNSLEMIMQSADINEAVEANIGRIDDAFMYVLTGEIDHAEQSKQKDRLDRLNMIRERITQSVQGQAPPEIQLLTQLVRAESDDEMQTLLQENQDLLSEELLQIVDLLQEQAQSSEQEALVERLGDIKGKIRVRLT